ncbi:MAG: TlyA family RNA methyltransferase [Dehalococcoidales bacterium]|nr:TlyA family RNA methyltransferase [Dehalococcoidales bacterium]
MGKKRIDTLLVDRGLVESRAKAQAIIMAGSVRVNDKPVQKAGTPVDDNADITVAGAPAFVGRGGLKLDHALDSFGIDVTGSIAIDVGASTGGFTDCLLQRGASKVYAIDVGYNQLDYRLRKDKRVVVMEKVNARYPVDLDDTVNIIVIDVSFISVEKILPSVVKHLDRNGNIVVLVKPQFEAEKKEVGKGGIIKNPQIHALVLARFIKWVTENGFRLKNLTNSPVEGASGNREFLVYLQTS